ncbi:tRNA (adenosine(37)-N6)-threonylcarbamoyltransferase complex dimerization subunit type 1 TsaB [Simkania negevensis]|uniref:tRNA (Adenosine(37)-N6)-threonylcarbamoyltransferase complex dimerization subunit type 1 TsaB n=1 Tax=Simkania negevensis TaxID=83561 RepID=A0ABS3AUZ6_9BACT|nr:tRNA (adenosine(37)-N6)-threonylcarbamoyltransferase complex dimerization subunit type 1 TsaB [Simkania negevensis]
MATLLLDTSTDFGVVAVVKKGAIVFCKELDSSPFHSNALMPAVDEALRTANLKASELHSIVVGKGPGSYTGIRVGVACAKVLSYACQIPLIGVCSLELFVPNDSEPPGAFASLIDARSGGIFFLEGTKNEDGTIVTSEAKLLPVNIVRERVLSIKRLFTPSGEHLQERLDLRKDQSISWTRCGPNIQQMKRIGETKLAQKAYTTNGRLEILYLRKTQPELKKGPSSLN